MISKESKFIDSISKIFKKHPSQLNSTGEADSELITLEKGNYAINIDDFSGEEDYFSDFSPRILGFNLVAATLSDLFASGATPEYFLHAITLDKNRNDEFHQKLLEGINDALKITSTYLLGGDTSTGNSWKYTGVAIGRTNRKIMRSGANQKDILYSTGKFGAGNRMGLIQHFISKQKIIKNDLSIQLASSKFKIRKDECKIIHKYANFAIDSSDGLINAVFDLEKVNSGKCFLLDISSQLIEKHSLQLSKEYNIPYEFFLFSTLGEYELIFGIPEKYDTNFNQEALDQKIEFIKIGSVIEGNGILANFENKSRKLSKSRPDPRNLEPEQYLEKIIEYITDLKNE